jgi:two-component system sensor histidine kinase KdpD
MLIATEYADVAMMHRASAGDVRRGPPDPTEAAGRPLQVPRWAGAIGRWLAGHSRRAVVARYGASIAGVAAVTWLIGLVLPHYHIANISMIYLLAVLALAVYAGSGPAIVASLLSFLAFDWFFVPPVGHFTVSDPDQWLALFLFLVVAAITGQLAAGLRRRAEEARRHARETSTLYELSMAILGDARQEHVVQVIAERMLATLGLRNVSVLFLDSAGALNLTAEAGEPLHAAERAERDLDAHWAIDAGVPTRRSVFMGRGTVTRPMAGESAPDELLLGAYLPISLGEHVLGAVAAYFGPQSNTLDDEARRLLGAFVAQTALAVGRSRLAEEEEKARAAAESERFKSIFLASVSHDLRTPLTAIKAAAEGLREDAESRGDTAHGDLSRSIDQEADRLNRLVGNLLEISRIEAGSLPLRREPEDLSEIVGAAVQHLTHHLADRTLLVDIPESLPLVSLDAVQMDRVLTNLLENAAKFSPPGTAIRLAAGLEENGVLLRIHNEGRSLTEAERRQVFGKFFRLESERGNPHSTGLGLAICKGIMEAHGGAIWAEPDSTGVTFALSLPAPIEAGAPL